MTRHGLYSNSFKQTACSGLLSVAVLLAALGSAAAGQGGKGEEHSKGDDDRGRCGTTNVTNITNIFNVTNITKVTITNVLGVASGTNWLWLNHYALLPGDSSVQTTFDAVSSGVGGGLTALVVHSTTAGDVASDGGNKVVMMAVEVPPGYDIVGVRVCYELTSMNSFIDQIRLAQVQNPPATALVLLDDPKHLTAPGPVCVDSEPTLVHPALGSVLLALRMNFGSTADRIAIRGVALAVKAE